MDVTVFESEKCQIFEKSIWIYIPIMEFQRKSFGGISENILVNL